MISDPPVVGELSDTRCPLCSAPMAFAGWGENKYGPHMNWVCSVKCVGQGVAK